MIFLFCAIVLSSQGGLIANSSNIKPGAICSKFGIQKVVGKLEFTCIKSGKKLVWNKGILKKITEIKSPTPAPSPRASSTPNPLTTPSPTPSTSTTPTTAISESDTHPENMNLTNVSAFADISVCKLVETMPVRSNTIGFVRPLMKIDISKPNILIIPFNFSDSSSKRISKKDLDSMSKSIHDYYFEQSYGKVDFKFSYTPLESVTGLPESISFGLYAKEYLPTSNTPEIFVQKLLNSSKENWKIQNYDGVIFTNLDTQNHDGGYAWSYSPNAYIANTGDKELQSPFGPMGSVVMADFDLNVLEHELGHSIFRFWDLYQHGAPINHTAIYDLMGDGMSADKNLFLWHRWLWDWVSDSQIHCIQEKGITRHFISPLSRNDNLVKGVVLQRSKNSGVVIENRSSGIILYSIDLSIGNGQGAIKVSQKNASAAKKGQSVIDFGVTVNVLDCFADGCLISVENSVKGVSEAVASINSNSGFGIPMMGAEADSKTTAHVYFKAGSKKSYEVQVLNQDKSTIIWTSGIVNSTDFEITVNLSGLECSKTYPVLVKIWSELDGKGNLATGANESQLQTPSCTN